MKIWIIFNNPKSDVAQINPKQATCSINEFELFFFAELTSN